MNRNVFMPKRNSSDLYIPFQYKEVTKSPALLELKKKTESDDKSLYSLKNQESNKDIQEIDRKTKIFIDQQRNPNKIQLAPIGRTLDPGINQKFFVDRERSLKNLPKDQKISIELNLRPNFNYYHQDPSLETLKNLEKIETLRKKSPFQQSVSVAKTYVDQEMKPINKQDEELKANLALIAGMRKLSETKENQKGKGQNSNDFQVNLKKFYGVDEDAEDELPGVSEFKNDLKPTRYAKTNLKSIVRDPITGATSSYVVERQKPRSLGSKPPEVFPGKIYDSPPQVKYELPKNTKKSPKSMIFNPLTHETFRIGGNTMAKEVYSGQGMKGFNN